MRQVPQEGADKTFKIDFVMVEQAIQNLLNENQKPTIAKLRKQLGISGSKQDEIIGYYLHIWEQRGAAYQLDDLTPNGKKIYRKQLIRNKQLDQEYRKRTRELEESLAVMRATFEATADGLLLISKEGKMFGYNQKFVKLIKLPKKVLESKDETAGLKHMFSVVQDPKELAHLVTEKYKTHLSGNCGEMAFRDGRIVERYYQPQKLNNKVIGHVWSFRDVTERKKQEQALKLRQRAIDASMHGIIIMKKTGEKLTIIDVNPAFTRITHIKPKETYNKEVFQLFKNVDNDAVVKRIEFATKTNKAINLEFPIKSKREPIWCELHLSPVNDNKGVIEYYVGILVDITERKKLEEQLMHQATYDALTKLPNRALILDRINQAIANAKRSNTYFALFFLDLDRFKLTNDSLGHDIGDELLQWVAKRLSSVIRESDTAGRLGGDEFIILIPYLKNKSDALSLAEQIIGLFAKPFDLLDHQIAVTVSMGCCIYPEDGANEKELMKNADIALYHAKEHGRNNFKFYQDEMNVRLKKRLEIEVLIRDALKNNLITVHYQPLLDANNEKLMAVEALLRVKHLEKSPISVAEIITVAEESGLIIPLGEKVLEIACHDIFNLTKKFKLPLKVCINISGRQLQYKNFIRNTKNIITKSRLNPKQIEFELTETVLMTGAEENLYIMQSLTQLGLSFSVDDFGTGYSSLSYLSQFPLVKLKIDKSFIDRIENAELVLIKAIISMGHSLGLVVLAEGVESKRQYDFLRNAQCDQIQGFYFSKPLSYENLIAYIEKHHIAPLGAINQRFTL